MPVLIVKKVFKPYGKSPTFVGLPSCTNVGCLLTGGSCWIDAQVTNIARTQAGMRNG